MRSATAQVLQAMRGFDSSPITFDALKRRQKHQSPTTFITFKTNLKNSY